MTRDDRNQGQQGHGMSDDTSTGQGQGQGSSRGGNFADDPARAREAGRKGGMSRGNRE